MTIKVNLDDERFRNIKGPLTQRQIAKLLGISHGAVLNIEKRALEKLARLVAEEWKP